MAQWFDDPRDVVAIIGPDASSYLQSQLSNDLRGLPVGDSQWSFLLQPTGKVDVLLRVWRRGEDEFVLDTDAGFGDVLKARLNRFKIRVKAEIEDRDWRSIAVRGASGEGRSTWGEGYDLIGPDVQPPDGIEQGSASELEALRIDAAWPRMGAEIVPGETIPAETGVVDAAVSFTKGCYPGQELVERMDSRGSSAPRHVRRIDVPAGTAVGDSIEVDGHAATVTSVQGTAALASVRRASVTH